MEAHDTPDPGFVKGFNEGYTITQHLPHLAKQLGEITSDTPRSTGFRAGRQQLLDEQKKQRYPAWLKGERSPKGPASGKTKDREPER